MMNREYIRRLIAVVVLGTTTAIVPGPVVMKKVEPGPPFTQEDEIFLKSMGILLRP